VPEDPSPQHRFGELSLAAFVDRLASSDPVPGGGSASAVAASLGAGLVAMVATLSDRPKYVDHAALHGRAREVGRRLATRFLQLADDDADAYGTFAAAAKLPRETDEERSARSAALAAAARKAAQVPLATVEACLELVSMAESLVGRSNVNAASDLYVATLLGEAAARGAAENVLVNLPSIGDEGLARDMTARAMSLLDSIQELAAAAQAMVRDGESREPLPA
jgi:formiminotetrahydrofolate cyclodeaminase